eukprot:408661_1
MAAIDGCPDYPQDRSSIYIIVGSIFIWWGLHLCLEKYCNMSVLIRRTASLQEIQSHLDSVAHREKKKKETHEHLESIIMEMGKKALEDTKNDESKIQNEKKNETNSDTNDTNVNKLKHVGSKNILMKLTKSLDADNRFRIRTRGSMFFVKVLFRFLLFMMGLLGALIKLSFIKAHFWDLDHCTTYLPYLQYAASLILSFYCWECGMLAMYHKVKAEVYAHHWCTIIAASNIIYGLYSPLATLYGILIISFNPFYDWAGAFRFQYAWKYPSFTRKMLKFGAFWFLFVLILCWIFSIIIIYRCFAIGFGNHHISEWSIVLYLFMSIAWGYDDIELIKTYYAWSLENYEDAKFDMDYLKRLSSGRQSNIPPIYHVD